MINAGDKSNRINGERVAQVETVLRDLRPAMEADAGGVELVGIDGGLVAIRLRGTCLVCPSVELTMKRGIEKTLRERLAWVTEVKREP